MSDLEFKHLVLANQTVMLAALQRLQAQPNIDLETQWQETWCAAEKLKKQIKALKKAEPNPAEEEE